MNYLEEIKARIESLIENAEQLNAEKELLQERVDQQKTYIRSLSEQLAKVRTAYDGNEELLVEGKANLIRAIVAICLLCVVILAMGLSKI